MAHKLHESYSGKNPVPTVALRSILDPSGATEARAKHAFGAQTRSEKNQQNETERMTKEMMKGNSVTVKVSMSAIHKGHVMTYWLQDPVTGDELVKLFVAICHGAEISNLD